MDEASEVFMRLPGFGKGSPLMPGLGGLTGKPAFFEKIGDPGDMTGKIFRGVGIVNNQPAPEAQKSIAAEPSAVQKQNTRERKALLVNK